MPIQARRQSQEEKIDPDQLAINNICEITLSNYPTTRSGYAIPEVASVKNNQYRGPPPAVSHHLFPLAISMCGEVGSDARRVIRALAEAKADKCD